MRVILSVCFLVLLVGCGHDEPAETLAVAAQDASPVEQAKDHTIAELLAHFEEQGMPLQGVDIVTNDVEEWGIDLTEVATLNYQERESLKVHYIGTIWRVKDSNALAKRKRHAELFEYPAYVNGLTIVTLDEVDPEDEKKIAQILSALGKDAEE